MTVAEFVVSYLEKIGIKNVFHVTGGGCMYLTDAFAGNDKIGVVLNLHEQASAIGADAYAQYHNSLGVALVTSGPGATNTITGVTASWIDSISVLIISGQAKSADLIDNSGVRQKGMQEVDIIPMVKPITKYAETILNPDSILHHLSTAIYKATTGRKGPVWLDIPLDVQNAKINDSLINIRPAFIKSIPKGETERFNEAIELIKKAKRPVFLLGNGMRNEEAIHKFKVLNEKLQIPILTTWKAMDFFDEDYQYYVGRPGLIGQRGANFIQQFSDLIISVGARLDLGQVAFDYKNFAPNAKKIIVDIDCSEVDKLEFNIDVKIINDASLFISYIESKKNEIDINFLDWSSYCYQVKKEFPICLEEYFNNPEMNLYVFYSLLGEYATSEDVIIPCSSGSANEVFFQSWKVKEGQRIFANNGLGSMGFGLPHAIGACFASGEKNTLCFVGDGCFQHNIQELELISRYLLPIKLFVINNNGYQSIRNTQKKFSKTNCGFDSSCGLTFPDTEEIAKAYDIPYNVITNSDELVKYVPDLLHTPNPIIFEIFIDPDFQTQPKVQSKIDENGKISSGKMEDMWPHNYEDLIKFLMEQYKGMENN